MKTTTNLHVPVIRAVCIRCGNFKRSPVAKCALCQFQPQDARDKAKSIILSTSYEIDGEYEGKTKVELQIIAAEIAKGQMHAFDDAEVSLIVEYAGRMRAVPPTRLAIDGLRWLLPPILVLAVVYSLLLWKW